jgi:hypothetical protein
MQSRKPNPRRVRARCRHCGERFEAHRRSARYCSVAHRMMAYRKRNAKKRYAKPPCDDEWYSPRDIIKAARAVLKRIDLDPASHHIPQRWIKAAKFYTKSDDGLLASWCAKNVWLNPPHSILSRFVEKLLTELKIGNTSSAILLMPTGRTNAYHKALAASSAVCICRRIKFEKADGPRLPNPFDSTLFYFGDDVTAFRKAFESIGAVMQGQPTKK